MKNIVFDMSNMHVHGAAFFDFLRLRKRFFVDELGWDIPNDGIVEMDQYDTPAARYSLVVGQGRVLAGARCQPSTASWGIYTTMLEDASRGILNDIPGDLFGPSFKGPEYWEGTRLVVSDEVTSVLPRTQCLAMVIDGLVRTIAGGGGRFLITLSPLALERTARLVGLQTAQASRSYQSRCDGRDYAVFKSKAVRSIQRLGQLGIDPETTSVRPMPDRRAI